MGIVKNDLFITLFERNLVRSYLQSDGGQLFKQLSNSSNVFLITNNQLRPTIHKYLTQFNLSDNISLVEFEKFVYNPTTVFCSSFLRFLNPSPATLLVIEQQYLIDRKLLKKILRKAIFRVFSRSKILKTVMRQVLKLSVTQNSVEKSLAPISDINSKTNLFITSLMPLRGEDIPVAIYFSKKGAKTIGTVRSWDNLAVNGCALFLPDKFLAQSQFIYDSAIRTQNFPKKRIFRSITPAYRKSFLSEINSENSQNFKFAYMCMGTVCNPDEPNFIKWLLSVWKDFPSNYELTLVQHPSFIFDTGQFDIPKNVDIRTFQFNETSLQAYYSFLSDMNLVFAGGTTGILDACFVETPVIAIGFEIVKQNFWISALRYFDYYDHTANFFKDSQIKIARSKSDLTSLILNFEAVRKLTIDSTLKYTGQSDLDYFTIISMALENN